MLVLGSSSPRRKEILEFFTIPFTQTSPHFDEESVPFQGSPKSYVQEIAKGKALSLIDRYPDTLILACDTIVYKEGKVYLKPNDEAHAYSMLKELEGKWHSVFSSISLAKGDNILSRVEESKVLFNPLSEENIRTYLRVQPYHDKAGSYFIQASGSLLVNRIEGCFYNIMGLPINLLYHMLKAFNIDLWDYLHE